MMQPDFKAGRIVRIQLQNIRGLRDTDLNFGTAARQSSSEPELTSRSATVIIGKNGTGKTTLLRTICIALSDPSTAQALLAQPIGSLISTGKREARIRIEILPGGTSKTETIEVLLSSSGTGVSITWEGGHPLRHAWFVAGYGAGRSIVGTGSGERGVMDNVLSLFDYRHPLLDPELTLRRLQDYLGDRRYATLRGSLKRILDLGDDDSIELPKGGGVEIVGPTVGGRLPLVAWADGYRLTLNWLLDLFGRALQAEMIDSEGQVQGIVLVDEIEQHLHPALQAAVVTRLTEQMPCVHFILTTHSPLVALGARPEELVPLRREGDHVVVEDAVPDYRGFSAEDMLSDERLFDTSAYAPDTQAQLDRYEELVKVGPDRRSKKDESELKGLARRMHAEPLPADLARQFEAALAEAKQRPPGDSAP